MTRELFEATCAIHGRWPVGTRVRVLSGWGAVWGRSGVVTEVTSTERVHHVRIDGAGAARYWGPGLGPGPWAFGFHELELVDPPAGMELED